jgi:hypothetical protein
MSNDLEAELRNHLHSRAARFDLAPGAVTEAAQGGRRRQRRHRAAIGGGMVLLAVGAGFVVTINLDRGEQRSIVTADGGNYTPDGLPALSPQLISRAADDAVPAGWAYLSGTLIADPNGCIGVATADGQRQVSIVWGPGWSAGSDNGKAVVRDAKGAIFAREGDRVGLGGGSATATSRYRGHPCWTNDMWIANDPQPSQVAHEPGVATR